MNNYTVHIYKGLDNIQNIHTIRRVVFIQEQNVPEELEIDGMDEKCVHITIEDKNKVIATARVIQKSNDFYIGRVAVLKDYRGQALGKEVMEQTHTYLKSQNICEVYLNAQIQVVDFYKKLGYIEVSEEFEEAGIIHKKMQKTL